MDDLGENDRCFNGTKRVGEILGKGRMVVASVQMAGSRISGREIGITTDGRMRHNATIEVVGKLKDEGNQGGFYFNCDPSLLLSVLGG